ncbi:MAG: DDE-type integrase/transposase/recombinase, partial [Chthoniobacter sp.]|nr:DDE-type integrase/transposase/recombinase [Chthoniobacter sp.]
MLTAPPTGSMLLPLHDLPTIKLGKVLKHTSITENLLSVSALCKADHVDKIVFDRHGATVFGVDGNAVLRARESNGLYVVETPPAKRQASANAADAKQETAELWHARLSHLSADGMDKLLAAGVLGDLGGLKPGDFKSSHVCAGCQKGKSHRDAFGKSAPADRAATRCLGRWHADHVGPFQRESLGGSLYMLVTVDEFSRKVFGIFQSKRANTPQDLITLIKSVQVETGLTLQELHTDGALEFAHGELEDFRKENGTVHTATTPHTSQHNGIAERAIRYIIEFARSMLHHANAPYSLWAGACAYAIRVRNMTAIRKGTQLTPDLIWNPKLKPSAAKLRVWGCDAWVHVPDADRQKLDAKAQLCLFLGFNDDGRYYLFHHVPSRKTFVSRDARFDERSFTQCKALRDSDLRADDSAAAPADDAEMEDFVQDVRF